MFRTSSFLAIALSVTAIGSATVPAVASPSKVFGGASNHLAAQLHPAAASTSIQSSQQVSHLKPTANLPPKIPTAPQTPGVSTTVGSSKFPMPKYPQARTTVGNLREPIPTGPIVGPLPPHWPPHCEALPSCFHPVPPSEPPQPPQPPHQQSGGNGPIVIVAPPVQVPVAVPVPVSVPVRVTASGSVAAAPAMPVITPHCGTAANIPALGAGIDELLPTAQLSEADMTKVTEFRQMIQALSAGGKVSAARDVEEIAMNLLGYQKVWLRCGLGTFDWEKQVASTQAGQAK